MASGEIFTSAGALTLFRVLNLASASTGLSLLLTRVKARFSRPTLSGDDAAIGAAMYQRGEPFGVCIKVDDLTKSAHVSIIDKSTGRVFDPYGEFFAKGLNCAIRPEILSL